MITGVGTAFPNDPKAVGARPTYRLRCPINSGGWYRAVDDFIPILPSRAHLPHAPLDRLPGFCNEKTLLHVVDHGGKLVHRHGEAQRRAGDKGPGGNVEHPENGPRVGRIDLEEREFHDGSAASAEMNGLRRFCKQEFKKD